MISVIVLSKDEEALAGTLGDLSRQLADEKVELLVVDASEGRLGRIRESFPSVRWIDYDAQHSSAVTIAAQRNAGLHATSAEVVVFTDAGCRMSPSWLATLTEPIRAGLEQVTAGSTRGSGPWGSLYESAPRQRPDYLDEAPTINLALSREVVEQVGDFDEHFAYGSDIDYTWRAVSAGFRIRSVPAAEVVHDWGSRRRQLKRSFRYGRARVRLHRKHGTPLARLARREPMVVAYPLFLLGLPIGLVFPPYLALLALPAWRARHERPFVVLVDHLVFGAGALVEALR